MLARQHKCACVGPIPKAAFVSVTRLLDVDLRAQPKSATYGGQGVVGRAGAAARTPGVLQGVVRLWATRGRATFTSPRVHAFQGIRSVIPGCRY